MKQLTAGAAIFSLAIFLYIFPIVTLQSVDTPAGSTYDSPFCQTHVCLCCAWSAAHYRMMGSVTYWLAGIGFNTTLGYDNGVYFTLGTIALIALSPILFSVFYASSSSISASLRKATSRPEKDPPN